MKTYYKLLIIAFLSTFGLQLFAQSSFDRAQLADKIESLKIGYFTQKLNLSSEESQAFWPVYNAFSSKINQAKKGLHGTNKINLEALSDKEIAEMVDNVLIQEQAILDIKKTYHAKFKELLPVRKVALLYKTEQDFRKEILNRWKQKQGK